MQHTAHPCCIVFLFGPLWTLPHLCVTKQMDETHPCTQIYQVPEKEEEVKQQ